jgi:hypothetical protein
MNLGRLRARKAREWVVLLLLPALAWRLLVPAGFMPAAGDGGTLTMQMCHGDAQSSIVIRLAGRGETPGDRAAPHDSPCAFAASAAVAPPSFAPAALDSVEPVDSASPPRPATPVGRALHHPHSPRAPPVNV